MIFKSIWKRFIPTLDCKTVAFFANAGDRQYANARRSGASVKTARENGEGRPTGVQG